MNRKNLRAKDSIRIDAQESSQDKEKYLNKSAETHLKIILGAEVAKAIGCKVEGVDKEFMIDYYYIIKR